MSQLLLGLLFVAAGAVLLGWDVLGPLLAGGTRSYALVVLACLVALGAVALVLLVGLAGDGAARRGGGA